MTDSLRDRIKAALKASNDRVAGFIGYDEMADAVIAALGLREECTPDIAGERWGVHRRIVSDSTFIPGPAYHDCKDGCTCD